MVVPPAPLTPTTSAPAGTNGSLDRSGLLRRSLTTIVRIVADEPSNRDLQSLRADPIVRWIIIGVEYAIVASLLLVAAVVLVHSVDTFVRYGQNFSDAVVQAIDSILVVIITLDIANTVFGHLRTSVFPVKPFIAIGILAGVRDILSSSAHLTLSSSLTQREFYDTLISLGVGVGVVVLLLLGLLILRFSGHIDDNDVD